MKASECKPGIYELWYRNADDAGNNNAVAELRVREEEREWAFPGTDFIYDDKEIDKIGEIVRPVQFAPQPQCAKDCTPGYYAVASKMGDNAKYVMQRRKEMWHDCVGQDWSDSEFIQIFEVIRRIEL